MQGPGALVMTLWAVVLLELVLPVPGALSLGAVYVFAVRPPWFPAPVRRLCGGSDGG